MDFTIYSIGSGAYLQQVLMAVVSFTSDGSFSTFVSSGMLLGVLFFAFQSIYSGGSQLNVGQLIVGFLIYAIMFGPKVDVAIEGLYDGYHGAVADVPMGIAAPGSIVSQFGYGLTSKFEQAFSGPGSDRGLTDGAGYADALKILSDVRRKSDDSTLFSAINGVEGQGSDFRTSWTNYIRECTAIKIDLDLTTVDDIYSAPDAFSSDGMKFDSDLFGTNLIIAGDDVPLSCSEAFSRLETWTNKATDGGQDSAPVYAQYARLLGLDSPNDDNSAEPNAHSAIKKSMNAMDALGESANEAQNYVRTAIIESVFQEGMAGRYEDLRDFSTATMINSAINQRNVQWASEQTMFMSIVRPMLTFIEGFAYAITPFMAFIIVLGGFGIKLAIKYGQMLLWIQLWLPVLAMTNFFLYMVASQDLGQLENYSTSFYAINTADARLANWVSVGGMLAAATPILTLVLLTGSAYAMTSLAQRMQGADHVDETQNSPDAVNPGAVMDQAAMLQNSQFAGRGATGASASAGSFNLGQMSQSGLKSSSQEMSQLSNAFAGQFSQSFSNATTAAEKSAHTEALADAYQSTGGSGREAVQSQLDQLGNEFNLNSQQKQQLQASATMQGGFNMSMGLGKLGLMKSNSTDMTMNDTLSQMQSNGNTLGAGFSESDQASIRDSLTHTVSDSSESAFTTTRSGQSTSSLSETASELTQASEQFEESSNYATSAQMNQSIGVMEAGHQLSNPANSGASQELEAFTRANPKLENMAQERATLFENQAKDGGKDMNSADALNAARLQVASERANYGSAGDHAEGMNEVLGALSGAYGINPNEVDNAGANQGLADNLTSPEAQAGDATKTPGRNASGVPENPRTKVDGHHDQEKSNVQAAADGNSTEKQRQSIERAVDRENDLGSPMGGLDLGQANADLMKDSAAAQAYETGSSISSSDLSSMTGNISDEQKGYLQDIASGSAPEGFADNVAKSGGILPGGSGLTGDDITQLANGMYGGGGSGDFGALGSAIQSNGGDVQAGAAQYQGEVISQNGDSIGYSPGAAQALGASVMGNTEAGQGMAATAMGTLTSEVVGRGDYDPSNMPESAKQYVGMLANQAASSGTTHGQTPDVAQHSKEIRDQ